jgi:hypothetical protein
MPYINLSELNSQASTDIVCRRVYLAEKIWMFRIKLKLVGCKNEAFGLSFKLYVEGVNYSVV